MANKSEPQPLETFTDFKFYLKCAKPLVLNLGTAKDRSLASAWIKRLSEDTTATEKLKSDYLKLLLFVLQKGKLKGPFGEHPSKFEELPEFPQNQNLFEASKPNLPKKEKPEYFLDFSGDLRSYMAIQEIPKFGMHCYYAMSNRQPLTMWEGFEESDIPVSVKNAAVVGLEEPKKETVVVKEDTELEEKKIDLAEKIQKKVKSERRKPVTMTPLGKAAKKEDEGFRPTWGTSLLSAKDNV